VASETCTVWVPMGAEEEEEEEEDGAEEGRTIWMDPRRRVNNQSNQIDQSTQSTNVARSSISFSKLHVSFQTITK